MGKMSLLKSLVSAVLLVVGGYYAFLGASSLLNLVGVTDRWIQLSGDPAFKYDFGIFLLLIGLGAFAVGSLGVTTAFQAIRTLKSQDPVGGWGALAVMVTLLHVPWLLYRLVATGGLSQSEATSELLAFATRSLLISAVYVLAWMLNRRRFASLTAG